MPQAHSPRDVFTAREIARAGKVRAHTVETLVLSGQVRTVDGTHVSYDEALRVLRALVTGTAVAAPDPVAPIGPRFTMPTTGKREAALPIAVSSSVHGGLLGALMLMAMVGIGETRSDPAVFEDLPPARMVFLSRPGPGGGGGGGGEKRPKPANRAERKGDQSLSSPLPERTPPPPVEPEPEPEPPPETPREPLPPVDAPVATVAADKQDRPGVVEDVKPTTDSRGPGDGGGAGTGTGVGLGAGDGAGIGQGSEAGTGGGPYRSGSDIDPPSLLRELKPDYTEDARRRGIEGDVVLEIVVRSNGTVGDVRVLKGLGTGLDQRAVDAVRQWRFSPAKRRGVPVDVIVEVAVEFRLR
jgi:periplasmic protein TonB